MPVTRKYFGYTAIGVISAALLSGSALAAQTSQIPNFSGVVWGRDWPFFEPLPKGPRPVVGIDLTRPMKFGTPLAGNYNNPILKPWAAEVVKKRGDLAIKGQAPADPANQCMLEPTPFSLGKQYTMQMLQHRDGVTIMYVQDHRVRHIHMNASHPKNVTPTWQGHSVGHYEGDTLVIDTVGHKIGPLSMVDLYGTPFTAALHVIERYRLIDGAVARDAVKEHESVYLPPGMANPIPPEYGRGAIDPDISKKGLRIDITIEDPNVFTTPWSTRITYRPTIGHVFPEVACPENNKGPFVPRANKPDF